MSEKGGWCPENLALAYITTARMQTIIAYQRRRLAFFLSHFSAIRYSG
jgi:hypothetical protein